MDMGNNKILVVEDVADYREMIMLFLRRSGYRAVIPTGGSFYSNSTSSFYPRIKTVRH
jgi:DNA-binding response OmpR family regulator